ncbi:MAG: 3-hydroxyacyl-CoA dehydrogenase family protein [Bacteroidia bacterium]|nr:3-hydroxyacyl-CoA dehydrogenase family protein [Bacteroidia bacterium]MDW8057497.1 3-hydroxyacyl-CoA dehydrogenase family protein [Bacteroidia bacterium]
MKTLVIGSESRLHAFMEGVGARWQPDLWLYPSSIAPGWNYYDIIVDLEADERPSPAFSVLSKAFWVFSAVKKPLRLLLPHPSWKGRCVGANLLPLFCQREVLEVSALSEEAWQYFHSWEPKSLRVPDVVGLVSARILALILNEALLLMGEAALSLETIDTAVKLGLNYPRTISEWGAGVGWRHILEILEALQEDYGAATYPIAPYLRTLALSHPTFGI